MGMTARIKQLHTFLEQNIRLRWLILLIYVVSLCFIGYYHEPWHDEAQAWLIARDDSLWHLITYTTHLEGHPPLWHLLLMPFAKMGVPFELGLKSVNIFICAGAMYLLIIKSPLSWYWRFLLPFSYFMFYQFGIVSRTYSLSMFALMLAAYYYPHKDTKPWHEAGALMLLSGSQAYSMMIACGIALAWFWDIVKNTKAVEGSLSWHSLWTNKGCQALLGLLMVALFWAYTMIPLRETAFMSLETTKRGSFWENMFFCIFLMPAQLFCQYDVKDVVYDQSFSFFLLNMHKYLEMDVSYGFYAYVIFLQNIIQYLYGPLVQLVVGYISFAMGCGLLFILPEIFFFILGSLVFLRLHHIGILACFYVFILWQFYTFPAVKWQDFENKFRKKFTTVREYNFIKGIIYLIFAGILLINLSWSIKDSLAEIKVPYDVSRDVVTFIRANHMEGLRLWVPWKYTADGSRVAIGSFAINAYFDKPYIENLNGGFTPQYGFLEYKMWDKESFEANLRKLGPPDICFGNTDVEKIFSQKIEYVPVHRFDYYQLQKLHVNMGSSFLYLRNDLLRQYPELHPLTKEQMEAPLLHSSVVAQ